jgi:hypothetical protein
VLPVVGDSGIVVLEREVRDSDVVAQ